MSQPSNTFLFFFRASYCRATSFLRAESGIADATNEREENAIFAGILP